MQIKTKNNLKRHQNIADKIGGVTTRRRWKKKQTYYMIDDDDDDGGFKFILRFDVVCLHTNQIQKVDLFRRSFR